MSLRMVGLVDLPDFADGTHLVSNALVQNVFQRFTLPKGEYLFLKNTDILRANLERILRASRQGFDLAIHPA